MAAVPVAARAPIVRLGTATSTGDVVASTVVVRSASGTRPRLSASTTTKSFPGKDRGHGRSQVPRVAAKSAATMPECVTRPSSTDVASILPLDDRNTESTQELTDVALPVFCTV